MDIMHLLKEKRVIIISIVVAILIIGGSVVLSLLHRNGVIGDRTPTFAELVDFRNIPFKKFTMPEYNFDVSVPESWGDMYVSWQKITESSTLKQVYRVFFNSSGNVNFILTDKDHLFSEFFLAGDAKEIETYDISGSHFDMNKFCTIITTSTTEYKVVKNVSCDEDRGIYQFEQVQSRMLKGKEVVYGVYGAVYAVPDTNMVIMVRYSNFNFQDNFTNFPLEESMKHNLRYILTTFSPHKDIK